MRKKNIARNYAIATAMLLIFVLFTLMIKNIDVKPIGPNNSSVGFATINKTFAELVGVNLTFYKLTNLLGYLAIGVVAIFCCIGIFQWVKSKSILKVNKHLFVLAGYFVVLLGFYVIFEIFEINYRPILMEGELEASYPSSHTMLAVSIFSVSILESKRYIKNKPILIAINIVFVLLMVATIVGRLICGVHWLTDIIGAIILSASLFLFYWAVTVQIDSFK